MKYKAEFPLKIPYPVIVEGKYDKLRLSSVIEANIIVTDGFGIFKNHEKAALMRALARKTPLIIMTDSDGAGKLIRSYLSRILPKEKVICLYIPQIEGKEKRKKEPSAEGFLGVEGIERDILYDLFFPYVDVNMKQKIEENPLTPAILCRDGLTGAPDSQARRDKVGAEFGLPPGMNAKAFLAAVKCVATYEEYLVALRANDNPPSAE
jgi:ribonuclease M5